ncbi:hypothetical protein GCM10020255_006390 [Rhodococcus baikonurensis]
MVRTTLTEFRRQANAAGYTITDEQDEWILQLPAHEFVDCALSAGPLAEIITSTDPSDLVYLSGQPLHRFDLSSRGSVPHLMVRCGDNPDNWFMLSRSGFDGASAADNIRVVLIALGVEMRIIDHITRHTVTHLVLDDDQLRTTKARHLGLPLPEEIEAGRRHLITLTGSSNPRRRRGISMSTISFFRVSRDVCSDYSIVTHGSAVYRAVARSSLLVASPVRRGSSTTTAPSTRW